MTPDRLLIGWGSRDITPDMKVSLRGQFHVRLADKINDPLTTTALALESQSGSEQAVIVSLDAIGVTDYVVNGCRKVLKEKLPEFDPEKLLISATHTHTAPTQPYANFTDLPFGDDVMTTEAYGDLLIKKISEAVIEAWDSRKPGAVSWGRGYAVVGFNRRMTFFDGSSVMYAKTDNPEFSHVEGCEDHSMDMLFTYDEKHKLNGMIINVPCPAQSTEMANIVSADFWHETREKIRKRYGEAVYILPQCAAAGDLSPRTMINRPADTRMLKLKGYSVNAELGDDYNVTRRQDIADKITAAVNDVIPAVTKDIRDKVEFKHEVLHTELTQRPASKEELKNAMKESAEWEAKLESLKGTDPASAEYSTAHKRLDSCRRRIKLCHAQREGENTTPVEMHCIRLGDIAMCSNRFEYFIDYGMRIKGRSKAIQTFIVQLAGEGTYLPTARALEGGGYGAHNIAATPIGPEGGQEIVELQVETINKMFTE